MYCVVHFFIPFMLAAVINFLQTPRKKRINWCVSIKVCHIYFQHTAQIDCSRLKLRVKNIHTHRKLQKIQIIYSKFVQYETKYTNKSKQKQQKKTLPIRLIFECFLCHVLKMAYSYKLTYRSRCHFNRHFKAIISSIRCHFSLSLVFQILSMCYVFVMRVTCNTFGIIFPLTIEKVSDERRRRGRKKTETERKELSRRNAHTNISVQVNKKQKKKIINWTESW